MTAKVSKLRRHISTLFAWINIILTSCRTLLNVRCENVVRKSIKPNGRLAVTLCYLATVDSFMSLEFQFRISRTAISDIVVETRQAIFNRLWKEFLQLPSTPEDWINLANIFEKRWNFLIGVGAVDGKRITIYSSLEIVAPTTTITNVITVLFYLQHLVLDICSNCI